MGKHDFAFKKNFFQEGYLVITRNNLNMLWSLDVNAKDFAQKSFCLCLNWCFKN